VNVKKHLLRPALSDEALEALQGERATDQHFHTIIAEDAEGYDADTGRLVFRLRKGVLSATYTDIARQVFGNIDKQLPPSYTRQTAAGRLDLQRVQEFLQDVIAVHPNPEKPFEGQFELRSGKRLQTYQCNPVRSYIGGYYYFRFLKQAGLAGFSKEFPEDWRRAVPFFEAIGDVLDRHMWRDAHRMHRWCAKHAVKPAFTIGRTCLSTVAVNVNYDSAFHWDRDDMKAGYSTLTAISVGGSYTGGYLVMPRYGIAMDVREGDILFNQSHVDLHGNYPIHSETPGAKRVSFVTYLKAGLYRAENRHELIGLQAAGTAGGNG
jgi:hypothetical protein